MSDYEDEDSVSSEGDVGEDSANGDEASDREFTGVGGEEELDLSASDPDVAVESVSDKERDGFGRRSQSGSDGSLVGDDRDGQGNEDDEYDEEAGHLISMPISSGRVRVENRGSGVKSDDGSPGSDYDEGVDLATNRQEAFSEGDNHPEQAAVGQKDHTERPNEVERDKKEDVDDFKDTSEPEPDDKGSDEDYQVNEDCDDLDEDEGDLQIVYAKELPTKNARRFGGVRTNVQSVLRRPVSRSIKQEKFLEPEVGDEEEEEEEEEEEDEDPADDPQDSDFDPTDGASTRGGTHADDAADDSEVEFSEEESDESLDLSDESDDDYGKGRRSRKRKTTRVNNNRTRVVRTRRVGGQGSVSSSDDDESSAKDSDQDESEEDSSYGRPQRKSGASNRRKRQELSESTHTSKRDRGASVREARTRTSSRALPRKSYAEVDDSEDSEDEQEQKRLKVAAEELEEEEDNGDAIERVLWHQPKGIAEAEADEGRHAEPFVLDTDPHAELIWEDQEFYIKWKGQSYLHCQWMLLAELATLSGYKKVLNYMKKIEEDRDIRQMLTPEEAELHDVSKEMELDLLKQYLQVERVFADRNRIEDEEEITEYLVKWKGLSYSESTWLPGLHQGFDLLVSFVLLTDCPHYWRLLAELQLLSVQPILKKYDILLIAVKALSSAYQPTAAIFVSQEIFDAVYKFIDTFGVFGHGFTYSGHPVPCAVSLEALKIYKEIDICAKVKKQIPGFQNGMRSLRESPIVGEDWCWPLNSPRTRLRVTVFLQNPAKWAVGTHFAGQCASRGILVRVAGNIIMMSPPLIIFSEEIDFMVKVAHKVVKETEKYVATKQIQA